MNEDGTLYPAQVQAGLGNTTLEVKVRENAVFTGKVGVALWQGKQMIAERSMVEPSYDAVVSAVRDMVRQVTPQLDREHRRSMQAMGYR